MSTKEHACGIDDARMAVTNATKLLPHLTVSGVGLPNRYYRESRAAVEVRIRHGQAELYEPASLRAVAACVDWIESRLKTGTFPPGQSSYTYAQLVREARVANGDREPKVPHGAFIAAGVGLGVPFRIDGGNVVFNFAAAIQGRKTR